MESEKLYWKNVDEVQPVLPSTEQSEIMKEEEVKFEVDERLTLLSQLSQSFCEFEQMYYCSPSTGISKVNNPANECVEEVVGKIIEIELQIKELQELHYSTLPNHLQEALFKRKGLKLIE
jgi:hypothetical protein